MRDRSEEMGSIRLQVIPGIARMSDVFGSNEVYWTYDFGFPYASLGNFDDAPPATLIPKGQKFWIHARFLCTFENPGYYNWLNGWCCCLTASNGAGSMNAGHQDNVFVVVGTPSITDGYFKLELTMPNVTSTTYVVKPWFADRIYSLILTDPPQPWYP